MSTVYEISLVEGCPEGSNAKAEAGAPDRVAVRARHSAAEATSKGKVVAKDRNEGSAESLDKDV